MISNRLWQAHFATDPAVIGRVLKSSRGPLTVVGVMPKGLTHPIPR